MRISVIIPVFNEAQNLRVLIPFLRQYGGDFIVDLIVVDGGSTDDSCQVAESLGAYVLHSEIKSRAVQMNLGAGHAKGNTLFFVHADTRPLKSFAEDIQKALIKGYKAGCFRYRFDSPSTLLKFNSWFTQFNGVFSGGGDQTLFITRDFFNTLGGYDSGFCLMEDFELVRRIKRKAKFHIIQKSMTVSARKYENNSWLRVQLVNLFVFVLFYFGTKPEKLKKLYSTLLNYGSNS
ncbi:glycosyltransferase [Algoriphagus lacus]|uniref:Glycosyltransferase n=1 Tax=Algoriphagus lacus TaxID=2056311 RepID=A0A418PSM4_9BACT|nr:glycosyltransferase [Algoriphagus lacus]